MKKKIKITVDVLMTIMIPLLMAYALIGETLHEWLGISIFVLFILHHVLNYQFIKNIFRGKYNLVRVLNLIVNIALFIYMFIQPITGIMMSKHLFSFLDFGNGVSFARSAHLVVSYWGYILMSIHLGFHMNQMFAMLKKRPKENNRNKKFIFVIGKYVVLLVLVIYGIYAFVKRGFINYLSMKVMFAFYDLSEPAIWFLLDYVAVMILFALVGYYLMKVARLHETKRY